MTKEQESLLRSLNSRLAKYIELQQRPAVWVTPKIIIQKTGWNKKDMADARRLGWVKYRENSTGGYEYNINSLDERFFNEKQTA